jgi:probable HAF family extracellular repeat protein
VPGYDVIDLGTLGGQSAKPYAFNDHGDVVGWSTTAGGESHAFLWKDGVMRDLAVPFTSSRAETITNSGLIAGVGLTSRPEARVFQWSNGVTKELGTVSELGGEEDAAVIGMTPSSIVAWRRSQMDRFASAIWSNGVKQLIDDAHPAWNPGGEARAAAMNGRGQIVGTSLMPGAAVNDVYHAFLWEGGVTRDLGVLEEFACGDGSARNCGESGAVDVNSGGHVIGWSLDASRRSHGVLWASGAIRDLGLWSPVAINDAGDVAGNGIRETAGTAYFWRDGILTILGSFGGGGTFVADLNDRGMVAGTSLTADGVPHAFVWKAGEAESEDLGTGPAGSPGAGIGTVAVAINARGDVLGYTCSRFEGGVCDSRGTYRAILWLVQDR